MSPCHVGKHKRNIILIIYYYYEAKIDEVRKELYADYFYETNAKGWSEIL